MLRVLHVSGRARMTRFEKVVQATIAANTVVVVWGLCDPGREEALAPVHTALMLFWVVELVARRHAVGPWRSRAAWRAFLTNRWNVFDTAVVVLSLLPALGVGLTVLRVARVARMLHSLRHVSHLRAVAVLRFAPRLANGSERGR